MNFALSGSVFSTTRAWASFSPSSADSNITLPMSRAIKDDVMRDLEVALEVAKLNPNATAADGTWKRIQAKLTAAKTTMEIAGLAYASYPHWPAIWDYFTRILE